MLAALVSSRASLLLVHLSSACLSRFLLIRTPDKILTSLKTVFKYNHIVSYWIVVVQSLSCVQLLATPWTIARQASLSLATSRNLLRFTSIELVMLSNCIIFCCLFFFCLKSLPASGSFPLSWLFASGDHIQKSTYAGDSRFLVRKVRKKAVGQHL